MSDRDEALRRAQQAMRRLQHEVRTPIGQIVGYAELLEEELEDRGAEDLAPDLQKIRTAAQRLLDLADGKLRDEQDPGAPVLPEPTEAEASEGIAAEASAPAEGAGAAPLVVVVDESANDRELLTRRLERSGFRVLAARDGLEALRAVESESPDLVVVEVLMSGMGGLEVLERIRRTRSRLELPVILSTALGESSESVEGLERGANDVITKPFDLPVVIARIQSQIDTFRVARQVAALAKQLEFRSTFIREALGRNISEDLLVAMSERPDSIDLGRELRTVTAVVADVRGTRARAAVLDPAHQTAVLKNVIDGLIDTVEHYGGVIDAVTGDSLVAVFGLPFARDDDAERAVACAVAAQLEMDDVNARNASGELPAVQIGVGVATGEVLILGLGSGEAVKYKAVGEPLVLADRIQDGGRAGEVWICSRTHAAVASKVSVDRDRTVERATPDGEPVAVHRVLGLRGERLISLRSVPD